MKSIRRAIAGGLLGAVLCAGSVVGAWACAVPAAGNDVTVTSGGLSLTVHVAGSGPPVLFIPSIGRDVTDFNDLATRVAAGGFLVIMPSPRGVRSNLGSLATADLNDLADDALTVTRALCGDEPATFVGQSYGSRIARLAAVRDGARIASIVLLGADDGQPVADDLRAAMSNAVAQGIRSERSRLEGLQTAFFAKGNDAQAWLKGWSPLAAAAQNRAGKRVDINAWLTGGGDEPVLLVHGAEDPVQPPEADAALAALIGPRARAVTIPQASHALLPEQPEALGAVVLAFLRGGNPADPALIEPLIRNRQGKVADCRGHGQSGAALSCQGAVEVSVPRG